MSKQIRPIAIYLPQFHPIPENDRWWGKGFTEWTNVVRARPRFPGHYQPHLPADLGFYDLRLPEVLHQQTQLAQQYGIYGFCFYHYWFKGKLLLERPLESVLRDKSLPMRFCICWANENWTRQWDGMNHKVLIEQTYSSLDHERHIDYLRPFLLDDRYIRVDGKPVILFYRKDLIPGLQHAVDRWRTYCRAIGVGDIYLVYVDKETELTDPIQQSFDASMEFQPNYKKIAYTRRASLLARILHRFELRSSVYQQNRITDYGAYVAQAMATAVHPYKQYPGVSPMWDNSARRKQSATIFHTSTPQLYEQWLQHVVKTFTPFSPDENFVFINAWNEWAEGNHLEPCQRWGHAYLQATYRGLRSLTSTTSQ